MSIHLGIYPSINYYFKYSTLTGESTRTPTQNNSMLTVLHSHSPVKILFRRIPLQNNEIRGCVSVVLEKFDNKLRKEFIQCGLEAGFEKVKVIDFQTARYLHATFYSEYVPTNGDTIWIIHNGLCHVWQKKNDRAKYIKSMEGNYVTLNNSLSGGNSGDFYPDVILYDDDNIRHWNFAIPCYQFQTCLVPPSYFNGLVPMGTTSLYTAKMGPLLHARLIGNDPKLFDYDVVRMLDRQLTLKLNGNGSKNQNNQIYVFENTTQLPLQCTIVVKKRREHNKLLIESLKPFKQQPHVFDVIDYDKFEDIFRTTEEEMPLPSCDNLILNFIIDENGIYTVNIEEMSVEKFKDINEFIDTYYGTFNPKCKYESQISPEPTQKYSIPRRIFTSNEDISIVGIDLGTTRCCAAVNRKNGIQTVALENTGERLLPSYVAYDEENVKCGQVVVGRLRNYSKSSVFDTKRIIGRTFTTLKVDESWTFNVINDEDDIIIQTEGFNNCILNKKPEEVSAELLKHVKQKAEEFQGQKLNETVITVPAAFEQAQKDATIAAANLAGWEKVHLLPEPVAAAFAYFIDRPIPENSNLLLFDLGGGTLDVCIFNICKGELNIISRSGDPNLGGRDFDNVLINYFKEKLKKDFGIILSRSKQYKLMQKCQDAKETLTVTNEYLLDVEDFGSNEDANIPINRKQFEELTSDLLQKLVQNIDASFQNTEYTKKDMDKVLYVGGGCRMPKVKELLREYFPHAEHCCEENPDEVVAVGAAYYAYYLKLNPIPVSANSQFIHYTVPSNATTEYCFPDKNLKFIDKIKAVGIDVGRKNCYAAVTRKDEITTIPLNSNGRRELPTYVAFDEEKEKCGQIAIKRLQHFAKSTIFDSQLFLGKQLEEINVDPKWPFTISTFDNKFKIQIQGPNGVTVKYPEEVCAVLLKHIKQKAEEFLDKKLNEVVIAIPPTYSLKQKDAIKASAVLAGWKRIHLLEEPYAATFAYFIHRPIIIIELFLLFDLGFNSLKVYIMATQNGRVKIIESIENFNCGVKSFDNLLMNYFTTELKEKYNIKLSENKQYKLRQKIQRIKHNLTTEIKDRLDVEDFDAVVENSYIEIMRKTYEKLAHELLTEIQKCILSVLDKAGLTEKEINQVLYVGGGCRMPMIKALLEETFPNSEHCCDENPEEVIALGAAYYAYHLKAAFKNDSRCSII